MSVQRLSPINVSSITMTAHPIHYLCTTTAELPATGLKLGDTAHTLDTNVQYKALSTTQWTPITVSGPVVFTKTAAFSDASAVVATTIPAWVAPFACTVTSLKGYRVGGTAATVQAYRGTTATPLRSAALTAGSSTWADGGAVQNTAFGIGDSLLMAVVSVTGSVTQVSVQVGFTQP